MNIENFVLFERYKAGELTKQEIKTFEERLSTDGEFRKEWEESESFNSLLLTSDQKKQAIHTIKTVHQEQISDKSLENRVEKEKPKQSSRMLQKLAYIAVAIGLLVGMFFFLQKKEPVSNTVLYASNYKVPDISLTTKGESNELMKNLMQAETAYKNKDYNTALQLLDTTGLSEMYQKQVLIAKAVSYNELDENDKSVTQFENLASKYPDLSSMSNWYVALILIKRDNISKATLKLQAIDRNSSYFKDAQRLLEILKR